MPNSVDYPIVVNIDGKLAWAGDVRLADLASEGT